MKITKIETHVLLVPDYDRDACSSAQDDIVVLVHTDEGITGIGEVDTNPWVAQAMIHARGTHVLGLGLEEMLLGEDPLQPEALWEKMYTGSLMTGRRGLVKGPYAHNKLSEGDDAIIEIVAACREAVGPDFVMMVDVCYCWSHANEALRVIRQLEPYDLFFLETPLQLDDLDGYAFLHDHSGIPIAAGELQNTRFEFLDLMDRGKVDVAQPDVGRVGGFTEARRVCDLAAERGRLIVPHCWKTGIGIAASAHLSAATAHCPYIEFLPAQRSELALRRELVRDELQMTDGAILPQKPGLGIELNLDALEKFRAQ